MLGFFVQSPSNFWLHLSPKLFPLQIHPKLSHIRGPWFVFCEDASRRARAINCSPLTNCSQATGDSYGVLWEPKLYYDLRWLISTTGIKTSFESSSGIMLSSGLMREIWENVLEHMDLNKITYNLWHFKRHIIGINFHHLNSLKCFHKDTHNLFWTNANQIELYIYVSHGISELIDCIMFHFTETYNLQDDNPKKSLTIIVGSYIRYSLDITINQPNGVDIPTLIEVTNSKINWSISQLLMPWLLALPGHQQLWYWFSRYNGSLRFKSAFQKRASATSSLKTDKNINMYINIFYKMHLTWQE